MRNLHTGKSCILLFLFMFSYGRADGRELPVNDHPDRYAEHNLHLRNDDPVEVDNGPGDGAEASPSPGWRQETIDTTRGADYMTRTEREVVVEINMLRSDPALYARMYLVPLRAYYQGRLLKYPGKIALSTHEGVSVLDECIRELNRTRPRSSLSPLEGLTLAARDHVRDQGRTGATGHAGSDGSSPLTRLNRYGRWDVVAGENISYGFNDARTIVTSLLIDDGVPSRGHRKNLLNSSFRFVGVDIGPHRVFRDMCVMDFAGGYVSNRQQEKTGR